MERAVTPKALHANLQGIGLRIYVSQKQHHPAKTKTYRLPYNSMTSFY